MISNPARIFVTGNETKEFIYEGGKKLFHFSPLDNDLSKFRGWNIVFFANDTKHALSILRRLLEFHIECYLEYERQEPDSHRHVPEYKTRNADKVTTCKKYLAALDENKVDVTLAPINQVYKVGWASNDTLF